MKTFLVSMFLLFSTMVNAQGTIVLIVDTSASISSSDMDLQLDSYAKAMDELRILDNINIEVILFNDSHNHISSGSRSVAAIAFRNVDQKPSIQRGLTCLTSTLIYLRGIIDDLPQPVVIDISGDGQATGEGPIKTGELPRCPNSGQLHETLDDLAATGAKVNTILIDPNSSLLNIAVARRAYEDMTRNNGFSMNAENFFDFEESLFEKLTLEVSQLIWGSRTGRT